MHATAERDVFVELCLQSEYVGDGRPAPGCINAGRVVRSAKRLMALARMLGTPILSCVDMAHPSQMGRDIVDVRRNGNPLAHKLPFSLLPRHVLVESDNCLGVALDVLERYQQAVFTKVHRDPFTNPKLDRLLTEMPARRFIVFGLPLESSVRMLALGLLRRNRNVAIVRDACGAWSEQEAEMALRQLGVKGCELLDCHAYVHQRLADRSQRRPGRARRGRSVA